MALFGQPYKAEFPLASARLPVYLSAPQTQHGLSSTISGMLSENEKLQEITRSLKNSSNKQEDTTRILKSLLPTLDGFDRVLHLGRSYPQNELIDNWLKSVESIYYRLLGTLENFGLYQMRVVGSKVDLNLHEVVEYRPSADHPNDVIISERQKGYILLGKLLREAKVVVAYNERSQ